MTIISFQSVFRLSNGHWMEYCLSKPLGVRMYLKLLNLQIDLHINVLILVIATVFFQNVNSWW